MKRLFSEVPTRIWVSLGILAVLCVPIGAQLQQSGGTTSVTVTSGTVTANQGGAPWSQNVTQFGSSAVATGTGVGGAGIPRVTVSSDSTLGLVAGSAIVGKFGIDQTTPGTTNLVQVGGSLPAGTAVLGYFRPLPAGCAAGTSDVTSDTVGVATGAGTSVSSTTGCIEGGYVNNITNSAVTFRLQDKTGTPIIWIGGNADFTIPANSNLALGPLVGGISFVSGITAIAGTASALNLHIVQRQ